MNGPEAEGDGKLVFPYVDKDLQPVGMVEADNVAEALLSIPPEHGLDLRGETTDAQLTLKRQLAESFSPGSEEIRITEQGE